MEKDIPTITLPGNIPMPIFGLGTLYIKQHQIIEAALDKGYRLLDTAYLYQNQNVIGEVLTRKIQNGTLKREDVFLTTKVPGIFMTSKDLIKRCLQKCLSQLQVSYVDLYLIHAPCAYQYIDDDTLYPRDESGQLLYADCDLVETWKGMESLVDEGLTRAIGVSNFNIKQLEQILKTARIPIANNQVESHVYLQQKALREFCSSHGISITSFGSLGNPGIFARSSNNCVLKDPVVVEMSTKYGKTPAQILLAFLMQEGVAVIPKTSTEARLDENMQAINLKLSEEDMDALRRLDKGHRYYTFKNIFHNHPAYPFVD